MIDFVSTRDHTDAETKRAAHFLAAVVALHVRDAAAKPTKKEAADGCNYTYTAFRAIEYLFSHQSDFPDHIEALGGSAAPMREALLSDRKLQDGAGFTELQRRVIQARYRWWKANPSYVPTETEGA